MDKAEECCLIRMDNVSFQYATSVRPIFQNLNICVKEREVIGILGESGSGKTTLLKLLAGLEKPTSGAIYHTCPVRGGFVFQSPVLLDWLNVENNITFPQPARNNGFKKNVTDLLRDVELTSAQWKFPRELSGGMRSRVQLARALYQEPKILFLDEAFSALDEKLRYQLNGLLKSLRRRYHFSAIVISHSIQEAVFLSDRIIIMKKDSAETETVIREVSQGLEFAHEGMDALDKPMFHSQVGKIRRELLLL